MGRYSRVAQRGKVMYVIDLRLSLSLGAVDRVVALPFTCTEQLRKLCDILCIS